MGLKVVTAPTSEPVTLNEAKAYLKVDGSADDTLIEELIKVSRRWAENYTGRRFIDTVMELSLDSIPRAGKAQDWDGVREGALTDLFPAAKEISLVTGPVSAVASVKYFDYGEYDESDIQTLGTDVYALDTRSNPSRIYLKSGQSWPTALRDKDAIRITFTAGYGSTAAYVPEDIKAGVKQILSYIYENRGDGIDASGKPPAAVRMLLDPYRILGFV